MTTISLCNKCPLNRICNIRVMEEEVGSPIAGIYGPKKERKLQCDYYDKNMSLKEFKEFLYLDLMAFMKRKYQFLNSEEYRTAFLELIYK